MAAKSPQKKTGPAAPARSAAPSKKRTPAAKKARKSKPAALDTALELAPTAAGEEATALRVVAAIDIGSSALRLDIGEVASDGKIRRLETLRHGVRLGKDVFADGRIHKETLRQCVGILKNYSRLLKEYGVTHADQVRAVATSFAREASNRDMFVDRVSSATGIQVSILEESEEARLTYLAVRDILEANELLDGKNVAILEIGGGQTVLLYIRDGKVTVAQTFHGGALRTHGRAEAGGTERMRALLKAYAQETIDQIVKVLPVGERTTELLVMGAGARFAAEYAASGEAAPDRRVTLVSTSKLADLADRLAATEVSALVREHHMTYQDAETVAPAMMTMAQSARAFKVKRVHVVQATLRDGILHELALRDHQSKGFEEQVIHSALTMAARYGADSAHAQHIERLAVELFDELIDEHQLTLHERLLLRCAAILHDIGAYVNARAHHKHTMYLIHNSDVFGLTRSDMQLVGVVARYHRKAMPNPSHPEFAMLTLRERMTVVKLAAILRVADALGRIRRDMPLKLEFRREADRFVILVPEVEDLTVERLALRTKGNLFADVFGWIPDVREMRSSLPSPY